LLKLIADWLILLFQQIRRFLSLSKIQVGGVQWMKEGKATALHTAHIT